MHFLCLHSLIIKAGTEKRQVCEATLVLDFSGHKMAFLDIDFLGFSIAFHLAIIFLNLGLNYFQDCIYSTKISQLTFVFLRKVSSSRDISPLRRP